MIDETKFAQLRDSLRATHQTQKDVSTVVDLGSLTLEQLSKLRDEINELLPDTGRMDLHKELATQYRIIKNYQSDVLQDTETPANQVAQVMNATVSALGQLIKMQESLERVEAFKAMESCLIEAVGLLPDDAKARFLDEYEEMAQTKGLA